ncbi:unnamed protein product [Orchesella dallaii]|uniref:Uncharacterized protein n=1 Tax=Orchesella dallaii TaxID=48710 RepID=A0ABP1QQL9_9HEXA
MESKSSATGSSIQENEKPKLPSPMLFIVIGFIVVIGFASIHLFLSAIVCFVIGFDFKTVLYVSTAAIVSGTVITMALAMLMALYLILSFFARFNGSSSATAGLTNLASATTGQHNNNSAPSNASDPVETLDKKDA